MAGRKLESETPTDGVQTQWIIFSDLGYKHTGDGTFNECVEDP